MQPFRASLLWWVVWFLAPATFAAWCPQACTCLRGVRDEKHLTCPPDQARLALNIDQEISAELQCLSSAQSKDFDLLEGLQIGRVESIFFKGCPLPTAPLADLIESYGATNVSNLAFLSMRNLSDSLNSSHFQNMPGLKQLQLNSNGLIKVPLDLLKNLPNLTSLDFRDNAVQLPMNFFSFAPSLTKLELGNNAIAAIEDGLLRNLTKLKLLNLWANRLTHINGSVFKNLKNLEALDLHSNLLQDLPDGVFSDLTNLKRLNLFGNNFTVLPANLFSNNSKLEIVRLYQNRQNLTISGAVFMNLPALKEVYLMRNGLKSVPKDLFRGSHKLTNISFSGNQLVELPVELLADQENLTWLDLSNNKLTQVPEKFFSSVRKLKTLRLGSNSLTKISRDLFKGLQKLEFLGLERNKLRAIDSFAMVDLWEIKEVHLSHNQLTFLPEEESAGGGMAYRVYGLPSPFHNCVQLQYLYLDNNSISEIFQDWSLVLTRLRVLNLTYNAIASLQTEDLQFLSQQITVDLRHNNVSKIDLQRLTVAMAASSSSVPRVLISNNPLSCTCEAFHLAKYAAHLMPSEAYNVVNIDMEDLRCASPPLHQNKLFTSLTPRDLTCPEIEMCPSPCKCAFRPSDTAYIVDCSSTGLTEVPQKLPVNAYCNHTELNLENNHLTFLPNVTLPGYEKVTHLFLSHNQLTQLSPALLSHNLSVLTIDHNNLTHLSPTILTQLNTTTLRLAMLNENPWACDCSARDLLVWIQRRFKLISFLGNVTCADGRVLSKLSTAELCPASLGLVLFCVSIAALGIVIGALAALYYRYQHAIRVWMYAHRCCLWLVTEEELDRDKRFDAFVSFSHKDEDFVIKELVPKLEASGLTLCLHYRDWVAGEWIPSQIARSVEASRRTLVVLSPSFLDSVWGRLEFRAAHKQALSEGRARVVMLLYGDLPPADQLDPELRAYITVNTYVKWGDPWFWDKLRYALPHAPLPAKKNKKKKKAIEDKLELMNAPETPTTTPTTPPTITIAQPILKTPPDPVPCSPPAVC